MVKRVAWVFYFHIKERQIPITYIRIVVISVGYGERHPYTYIQWPDHRVPDVNEPLRTQTCFEREISRLLVTFKLRQAIAISQSLSLSPSSSVYLYSQPSPWFLGATTLILPAG